MPGLVHSLVGGIEVDRRRDEGHRASKVIEDSKVGGQQKGQIRNIHLRRVVVGQLLEQAHCVIGEAADKTTRESRAALVVLPMGIRAMWAIRVARTVQNCHRVAKN